MITVLFFAQLKELLSSSQYDIHWNQLQAFCKGNPPTLQDAILFLSQQKPEWQATLTQKKWLVAHNQTLSSPEQVLRSGDEVAIFPPVTGG